MVEHPRLSDVSWHELERVTAQWRLTFDAIASPILNLSPEGTINRLNRCAKEMVGRPYREIVGRSVVDVGGGPLFAAAARLAQRAVTERGAVDEQVANTDGDRTWDVTAHYRRLPDGDGDGDGGTSVFVVVVARDVTEFVEMQESLRRSETLSALGSLIGGVAHQVRNPLFGITAALDAFESRFGDRPDVRRYAEAMREPADRLQRLLSALLEYGKPSFPETVTVGLGSVAQAAVSACETLAVSRGVRISVSLPPISRAAVTIDRERVREALVNLIDNAVRHSPEGGVVAVTVERRPAPGGDLVRFQVGDSGEGFPEEDVPRLTEPFFSRRHGGTGLGLALVQRIVHDNNGRLELRNADDGGAEAIVTFPTARERP